MILTTYLVLVMTGSVEHAHRRPWVELTSTGAIKPARTRLL
jgi:hypothetical protein